MRLVVFKMFKMKVNTAAFSEITKYILFFLIFNLSVAESIRIPLKRAKSAVEVDSQIAEQFSDLISFDKSFRTFNATKIELTSYLDDKVYASLSVGTPPTRFNFLIDTGKLMSWISSARCLRSPIDECFCLTRNFYKSDRSNSYTAQTTRFEYIYGGNHNNSYFGRVAGRLATDDFRFGNYFVNRLTFGEVYSMQGPFFINSLWDGSLGLGLVNKIPKENEHFEGIAGSLMMQIFDANRRDFESNKNKRFSLHFLKHINMYFPDEGQLRFAEPDSPKNKDILTYVPVVPDSTGWTVPFKVDYKLPEFAKPVTHATFDSALKYISGPAKQIDRINRMIRTHLFGGLNIVDCAEVSQLIKLKFKINTLSLTLNGTDYTIMALVNFSRMNICYSSFVIDNREYEVDVFTLGISFLKNYYVVFDFHEKTIGIAEIEDVD